MARLWTSGAEWNDASGDAVTLISSTFSSANPRTGTYHWRNSAASNGLTKAFTGALATTYFLRSYLYVSALPAAPLALVGIGGASPSARINLNADGSLDLKSGSTGATLVGSTAAGSVAAGSYFLVEVSLLVNSAALDDSIGGRFNSVSFASASSVTIAAVAPTNCFIATSDGTVVVDADDAALNDSTGASQTSWPGSGKVRLLLPISLNTNGGSWTDDAAATTSAALTAALDNAPPKGIADTTAGGGDHMVRNAAANTSLDMNLATYATGGITAADTINVLEPHINVGAPVVTGAKTGSYGIVSNPAITNRVFTGGATAAANFWRGVIPGTYPSNWTTGWERGTVTYAPSVTVGTSPVARVTITGGTTTRIAMVDAMGLMVDYTPAAPKSPPFQARTQRNMLLRR